MLPLFLTLPSLLSLAFSLFSSPSILPFGFLASRFCPDRVYLFTEGFEIFSITILPLFFAKLNDDLIE